MAKKTKTKSKSVVQHLIEEDMHDPSPQGHDDLVDALAFQFEEDNNEILSRFHHILITESELSDDQAMSVIEELAKVSSSYMGSKFMCAIINLGMAMQLEEAAKGARSGMSGMN